MKVALITAFSPDIGGGSVQLKSLLSELKGIDVAWHYLAAAGAASHQGHWLGRNLSPRVLLSDLFARAGLPLGSTAAVKSLVSKIEANTYWVVAHNDGVCIAAALLAAGKKVHLTVHDDPVGVFARSRKYRPFQWVMSIVFSRVIRNVASVDVTSPAMRDLYSRRYGVDCFPQFRYVPSLMNVRFTPSNETLRIGHIGSLYHPKAFRRFVSACQSYAAKQGKRFKIVRIGTSQHIDKIANEIPDLFEDGGELKEEQAINLLATCDFVYAMYPSGRRFRLFRQTSFPVKLATYIQAQRPIFAHAPGDSTLAKAVSQYRIGEVCSTNKPIHIERSIAKLLGESIDRAEFEDFRASVLGSSQIPKLRMALGG